MKSKIVNILKVLTMVFVMVLTTVNFCAITSTDIPGLSDSQEKYVSSVLSIASESGADAAAKNCVALYNENKRYTQEDIIIATNALIKYINGKNYPEGAFVNNLRDAIIREFNSAGISLNAASSKQAVPSDNTQAPNTKSVFTVTECTPYPAWATKDCNIRSGADTTYDKVGSLKKFEQVTVTGTASTGWFRITTSDGKEAYISNTLLTTQDPTSVSLVTVDKSGAITEHTVEGDNPEAVAQVVEQIKEETAPEEEAHEHSYTSEVTTEPTCTTVGTMTYTCECGDTYTEEIPMVEHIPGEWEISKTPTLISTGEQVKKCTVCGETLETEIIPAKTVQLIGIIAGALVVAVGTIAGVVIYKKKH